MQTSFDHKDENRPRVRPKAPEPGPKKSSAALNLMRHFMRTCALSASAAAALGAADGSMQLRHLQVVHRHGDRTPLTPLADKEYWAGVIPSQGELDRLAVGTTVVKTNAANAPHPAAGDGVFGTLSLRGVEMMRVGGLRLREQYPDFIPPSPSPESVRVHCTDFPRTLQSVQALLQGLFPAGHATTVEIDATRTEQMIPDAVPRVSREQEELESAVLRSEAVLRHASEVEPLRQRYSEVLLQEGTLDPSAFKMAGVGAGDEAGTVLSWNKLAEVLKCLQAYGRLPAGLSDDDVKQASGAGAHRWTALMRERRLAQLAMGRMASSIVASARAAALDDGSAERLVLWSGHDSTLFGLLAVFELDAPAAWPPYGSQLHVELLEEKVGTEARPRGFYLRFSLNGESLRCALVDAAAPTPLLALDAAARAAIEWEQTCAAAV